MQIVDTHQHLWDLDLFRYSWLSSLPQLNRSFRMADYLTAAKGLNVVKSVHLEADVDEPYMLAETRYLRRLPINPIIHSRASWLAAGRSARTLKSYLDKIAGHPKLKGIRRVLHTQPDEVGQGATFIRNVAALSTYGLSFDICVLARQLPIAMNLVSTCADVGFILDHCGVPQVKEKSLDPLAFSHHRNGQVSKRLLQNLRPRSLCRSPEVECGRPAAIRRTCHRELRLGPRTVRE